MTEEKRRQTKQNEKSTSSTREQQYSNRAMISVFLVGASVSLLAYMRNIISSRPDGSSEKVTDSVVNCLWFLSAIIAGTSVFAASSGQYLLVSGIFATDDIISDGTKTQSLSKPIFTGVVAIVLKNAMFGTVEDMTRILPMLSVALLTSGILVLCWAEMHTGVAIVITLSFFLLAALWYTILYVRMRRDERYTECCEFYKAKAILARRQARKARQAEVLPK